MNQIQKHSLSSAIEDNYFSNECSNPISWYRQHSVLEESTFNTTLFNVMDMKHTVLTEQYAENKPEYVWNL